MISIIAAIGKNNELGKNNGLIWHLPNDLKFFKEKTINQTIVMGYNTFVSLGRVLPKRTHIVLSSEKTMYFLTANCSIVADITLERFFENFPFLL